MGLLHLDIIRERLEREYDLDLVITVPSVGYRVYLKGRPPLVLGVSQTPVGRPTPPSKGGDKRVVHQTLITHLLMYPITISFVSKKLLKYFLSLIISAGILFLLLKSVDPQKIVETLSAMDNSLIVWIVLFYAGMLVFRTLRYRVLFGSAIPFVKLFGIVNVYNFLNEFLPFRSGELAYLYMIRQAGVPAGKNVSSLIVVRVLDFLVVVALGFSALGILLSQGLRAFGIEKYACTPFERFPLFGT